MEESFSSFSLGATTQPAEQSGTQADEKPFIPSQLKRRCWSLTLYPPRAAPIQPGRRGWSEKAQLAIKKRSSSTAPDALSRLLEDPRQPPPQSAYASFPEPVSNDPEEIAAGAIAYYLMHAQSGCFQSFCAIASCAKGQFVQRGQGIIVGTCMPTLRVSLHDMDEYIHGPTAATLANLLESTHADEVRTRIGMEGASRLLTLVLSPSQPVVREAVRALIAFGLDRLEADAELDALLERAMPILLEHRGAVVDQ